MKKILLLVILFLTLFLTGCGSSKLKSLSYQDLKNKINNKESFIVYFGSESNTNLEKKLNTALENNNLEGFKVNTSKLSDDEKNTLQTSIPYEDSSIVFIIEGRDPSKLTHITNEDISVKNIEERLKNLNFIK